MKITDMKLYTRDEVIKVLRLDSKRSNPINSLNYLIRTKQLKPIKICGVNMFTEKAITDFFELCEKESS